MCAVSPLSQAWEVSDFLVPYWQGSVLLCSCHDCHPKGETWSSNPHLEGPGLRLGLVSRCTCFPQPCPVSVLQHLGFSLWQASPRSG